MKITPPDITFTDSFWIYGSKRSAKLIECRNGHTGSDVVLLLPNDGIAFMGDLLFSQRHPWLADGDPNSWIQHLETFEQNSSISIYVPGHGPVTDKNGVKTMILYIQSMQQIVENGINKNWPDSAIIREPVPSAYTSWWFEKFYQPNLRFLYDKMKK